MTRREVIRVNALIKSLRKDAKKLLRVADRDRIKSGNTYEIGSDYGEATGLMDAADRLEILLNQLRRID
jgi:hypothetical protein